MDMKDEIKVLAAELWQKHRCKTCGLFLGLVIGAAILLFGFWNTVFVLVCGLLGLMIGIRMDKGELVSKRVEQMFFDRFQR